MRMESVQSLATAAAGPWIPVNYHQKNFQVSLNGTMDNGAAAGSGTWEVQHTFDDPNLNPPKVPTSLTRTGALVTVILPNHGLRTGDSAIVYSTGDPVNLDTQYSTDTPPMQLGADVTVVDANTFTYACPNAGATVGIPGTRVITLRVMNHDQMVALTSATDGNYAFPVRACRARVTVPGAGNLRLVVTQGQGGMGG